MAKIGLSDSGGSSKIQFQALHIYTFALARRDGLSGMSLKIEFLLCINGASCHLWHNTILWGSSFGMN